MGTGVADRKYGFAPSPRGDESAKHAHQLGCSLNPRTRMKTILTSISRIIIDPKQSYFHFFILVEIAPKILKGETYCKSLT